MMTRAISISILVENEIEKIDFRHQSQTNKQTIGLKKQNKTMKSRRSYIFCLFGMYTMQISIHFLLYHHPLW